MIRKFNLPHKINTHFKNENRHILLFVDNFSGHSPKKGQPPYELSNVKIHYYPPNCTSVLQPMDQGVINSIKFLYRKQIIARRLNAIEYGYELESISVLDAIRHLDTAWKNVTPATIRNCFRKAGYKEEAKEVTEEDINLLLIEDTYIQLNIKEYLHLWERVVQCKKIVDFNVDFNYQDFLNIDNNLASGGDLTNEEIIEQVTVKSTEYQSLNQKESDDEEEEHIINPVSKDEKVFLNYD